MNIFQIDRKIGPVINTIPDILLPEVSFYTLSNGIPVYEVNAGTQEVFKLEVLHVGGRLMEDKKLLSRATASLIKEASEKFTHQELTDVIDFYGASLSSSFSMDNNSLVLYSLNKHAQRVIPVLSDVVFHPRFSEKELRKYITRNINNLKVETSKNDVYAYREFTDRIFGKDHIYGYNSSIDYYHQIVLEDLQMHFQRYYGTDNCVIFLSGKITDDIRNLIDRELGKDKKHSFSKYYSPPSVGNERKEYRLKGKNDIQSALIIGRRLFDKSHYDYPGMVVLNTILGGYFSSRLMKSIREKEGLTYNISSIMDMLKYDGFLYISTEVAPENVDATLNEIYLQLEILQNELVSSSELNMVKNYILGNVLNMLDGPFKISKWIKSIVSHEISIQRGHEIIQQIKHIEADYLRELARKYLHQGELSELVVL